MKLNKIALLTAMAVTVTGAAFAAPQTTFEQGQVQVDAGAFVSKAVTNDIDTKHKTKFTGGLTYAVSDNDAFQYQYTGLAGKFEESADRSNVTGNMHEVNYIHSFSPNLAGYAGYARIDHKNVSEEGSKVTNNIAQFGLIGKADLAKSVSLYGKAGLGTKHTSTWEAGVALKPTKDLDVNVGYRYINTQNAEDGNVSFKGLVAGLSYRFGGHTEAPVYEAPAPVVVAPTPAPVVAPAPVVVPKNDYYVESIHFGFDESTPLATQQANLDLLVSTAKAHPSNIFKLVGNTDSRGNDAYNQNLSKERVDYVYNYAVKNGVPASQLKTMYKGATNPASTNSTDQGRADNRRVDVYINK